MTKKEEELQHIGKVEEREISLEMKESYIDYAMSKVEVENAKNNLPDLYIKSIFSIMNL